MSTQNKWICAGFVTLVLVIIGVLAAVWIAFPNMAERGQFGDMFGTINALFSGFAFLGVVAAIYLQREELRLQRKELELTRQELKRTAEAQEQSGNALIKQADSLKRTAKLNGLSAILQHTNMLIQMSSSERWGVNPVTYTAHKAEADKVINQINKLIEDK